MRSKNPKNIVILEGVVVSNVPLRTTRTKHELITNFLIKVPESEHEGAFEIFVTAHQDLARECAEEFAPGVGIQVSGRLRMSRKLKTTEIVANGCRRIEV